MFAMTTACTRCVLGPRAGVAGWSEKSVWIVAWGWVRTLGCFSAAAERKVSTLGVLGEGHLLPPVLFLGYEKKILCECSQL